MKHIVAPRLFTPKGFVVRAAILVIVFAICHAAGWREHTSFLSGTVASASDTLHASAVLGVIYIASYLGIVMVAPILLLAAALLFGLDRLWRTASEKQNTSGPLAHELAPRS